MYKRGGKKYLPVPWPAISYARVVVQPFNLLK